MAALGLNQQALARELGVSLDRVKSLTSGRVAKLAPSELAVLTERLHVNPYFLTTGVGSVLVPQEARGFEDKLAALKAAAAKVAVLNLPDAYRALVRDVLFAVEIQDAEAVTKAIDQQIPVIVSASLAARGNPRATD